MASTSVSTTQLMAMPQLVAASPEQDKSKLELALIARAFAYHKVLAIKAVKDIDNIMTDSENEYDEFGSDDSLDSLQDSDDDDDDDDDEDDDDNNGEKDDDEDDDDTNGEKDDDVDVENKSDGASSDTPDSDDEDIERHLLRITIASPLILNQPHSTQVAGVCNNSRFRNGLWLVTKNDLIDELTELEMGFLSQVAHIALQAKLHSCGNKTCDDMRKKMEVVAPLCKWSAFRGWALVAMSCQAAMDDVHKVSHAHTHLARAVAGFCMALKKCLQGKHRKKRFLSYLDGDDVSHQIDLADVANLIYWMARIQSQLGIGPKQFGRWNHHLLPSSITLPSIEAAALAVENMGICKNRLWNLVNVSDRKQSDLPDIVLALDPYKEQLFHKHHDYCTPNKCQWAQMDSTGVTQLHKCKLAEEEAAKKKAAQDAKGKAVPKKKKEADAKKATYECKQMPFPVELLETALEMGKSTAWLCDAPVLSGSNDPYIAISHVWSDGTGVGVKNAGIVNKCLFRFFASIATALHCKAVWWDAISIPKEPKARSKALNKMHGNYANAQFTVVHDTYLLNFPWAEDGSPCLALVLSTWFTRGWTALELFMAKKVIVLFKDPHTNAPVMKDLDEHILAKSPSVASRAHWLATTLIQRLRRPIDNVGDLLAVLSPRSTSWVRDRTIISALLTGVPDCDFTLGESIIATKVLEYLGKIPYSCLLHGKPTMRDRGKYSWCAATLDDMPVDISTDLAGSSSFKSNDYLEIDEAGAVEGKWRWRKLQEEDVEGLRPHGNDLAAGVKVATALRRWNRCLLLRHPSDRADSEESLALLAVPISIVRSEPLLKCRYIGAVVETRVTTKDKQETQTKDVPKYGSAWSIRIGGKDRGGEGMLADTAEELMDQYGWTYYSGDDDDADEKSINGDEESGSSSGPAQEESATSPATTSESNKRPRWLDIAERAAEYPPAELMGSLSLEDPSPPKMGEYHLLYALKSKNEDAARYLVANGMDLGSMDAEEILSKLGEDAEDGKFLSGLKMLGDIFVDEGRLDRAIEMYTGVVDAAESMPPGERTADGLLRLGYTKYALGRAHVKQWPSLPPLIALKAHQLFQSVLESYDEKDRKRAEAEQRKQDKEAAEAAQKPPGEFSKPPLKRANTTMREKKGPETAEQRDVNQIKSDQRWYRLELNAAAELTLLNVATFELRAASKNYGRALKRFGPSLDAIEGFEGLWQNRRGQSFKDKESADERAAEIYHRALKRFDTMFHKNHVLIAITSLHLGINYMLRSMFSQAEEHLNRALEGFQVHLCCPLDAKACTTAKHSHNERHPIFGLTYYYLGLLSVGQQRFKEAQRQLEKAQSIAASSRSSAGSNEAAASVLELSAAYARGNSELLRRQPDFNKAEAWFRSMTVTSEELRHLDDFERLAFQAKLGLARVLLGRGERAKAVSDCEDLIQSVFGLQDNLSHDRDVCEAIAFLGDAHEENGNLPRAEEMLEMALEGFEFLQGDSDHEYLQVARKLGVIYGKNNKLDEAQTMLLKAYENLAETVGSYHSSTLKASWHLGRLYLERRNLPAAAEACELAYTGFRKIAGSEENRSIAETAQTLGDVYFEQAKLSKAKEMYEAAFKAFNAVACARAGGDKGTKSKVGAGTTTATTAKSAGKEESPITDKATLLAALDVAKVSAFIRHSQSYEYAEKHFKLAVDGFHHSKRSGKGPTLVGLDAKLQLGSFYRERRRFTEAETMIEGALQGLLELHDKAGSGPKADEIEVKTLQTKLALGQLRLDQQEKDEKETGDVQATDAHDTATQPDRITGMPDEDVEPETLIEEAQAGLLEKLGPNHVLSLHASTVLGELYMTTGAAEDGSETGDNDAPTGERGEEAEDRGDKGEKMLLKILGTYRNILRLARGHPKILRVIEILIAYYNDQQETDKSDKMKARLWDELEQAYGVDIAAMIMDVQEVRRPVRDDYPDWDLDSDSHTDSASDPDSDDQGDGIDGGSGKTHIVRNKGDIEIDHVEEEDDDEDDEDDEDDMSSWDSDSDEEEEEEEEEEATSDADDNNEEQDEVEEHELDQDYGDHFQARRDSAIQFGEPSHGDRYSEYRQLDKGKGNEYRFDKQQLRQQQAGQHQPSRQAQQLQPKQRQLRRQLEHANWQLDDNWQQVKDQQQKSIEYSQSQIDWASEVNQQLESYCQLLQQTEEQQGGGWVDWAISCSRQLEIHQEQLSQQRATLLETAEKEYDWAVRFDRQVETQRQRVHDPRLSEEGLMWASRLNGQLESRRQRLGENRARDLDHGSEQLAWAADIARELDSHRQRLSFHPYRRQQQLQIPAPDFQRLLEAVRQQFAEQQREWQQFDQALTIDRYLEPGQVRHEDAGQGEDHEIPCPVCRIRFTDRRELDEHMARYGEVEAAHRSYQYQPASCQACSMHFPDVESRDRHVAYYAGIDRKHQALHGERAQCPACGMKLPDENGLNEHLSYYSGFDQAHRASWEERNRFVAFRATCRLCGLENQDMSSFEKHLKTRHRRV